MSKRELVDLPCILKHQTERAYLPFTLRPVGAPGSTARAQQDMQIAAHKHAKAVLAKMRE